MTLDELREELKDTTATPWRVSMSGYSIKSDDPDVPIVAAVHGGAQATSRQLEAWVNNANLIVAAVNALPALLDLAEAVRDMITVCQYPCGHPSKCGNCRAVYAALAKLGE